MKLPIRIRLALSYCAAFFLLIAALELAAYYGIQAAVYSIVDRELESRLAGLDDHLTRHIDKQPWQRLHDSLTEHPAFQPEYFFFQKVDGGEVMFRGAGFRNLPNAFLPSLNFATIESDGQSLRVLTVQRSILGQHYNLALATDLGIPSAVLTRFGWMMLLSLPAVLLAASAMGYWIAGRALAPIAKIIAATRAIDSRRLNERIAVPDTGDEVRQLAETINGMLIRIENGFRQIQQFIANASHELRTPVAVMRAYAEVALLKSPSTERDYQDALHKILREAERNSALLEDMLQLARADSGYDHAKEEPVDLARSVAHACAVIAPLAESKGLRIVTQTQAEPCWICAGEDHLRRLWLILLENAVHYTPNGRISVSVSVISGAPRCTVRDTGVGISPEHLPMIFERFYRVDKARSRADGGTGLGLSIASELARLYGAVIEVESTPGNGSAFHVTFPAHLRINPASMERANAVVNSH